MDGKELLQKYYEMVTGECDAEDHHEISRIEQGSFLVNLNNNEIKFVERVGFRFRDRKRITVLTERDGMILFAESINLAKAVGPRWAIKGYLKKNLNRDAADVIYAAIR